jgi:chromosome segregation ATPase
MTDPVTKPEYLHWSQAGGPNECEHGYAEGIPCPNCDAEWQEIHVTLTVTEAELREKYAARLAEIEGLEAERTGDDMAIGELLAEVKRLEDSIEWLHNALADRNVEVERLRAEVEQVELINFRRVEENTRLRKALTMIRNAVDITRDQVTEGWIIGVADDALKLG